MPGVQAEGGPLAGRLRLRLGRGGQRPRGERGVREHAAAPLPGLHQRPLLRHHIGSVALRAGPGLLRVRGRRAGQQRQRGGHRGDRGGADAAAVLRGPRTGPAPSLMGIWSITGLVKELYWTVR